MLWNIEVGTADIKRNRPQSEFAYRVIAGTIEDAMKKGLKQAHNDAKNFEDLADHLIVIEVSLVSPQDPL